MLLSGEVLILVCLFQSNSLDMDLVAKFISGFDSYVHKLKGIGNSYPN
jgi:hypothetical protein